MSARPVLNLIQKRTFTHMTWVSGPPRNRVPFAEKVAHGAAIWMGVMAGPMWIMGHIHSYKKKDED